MHRVDGDFPTRHRFFKGSTRPAMFLGVPLMPFLGVTGVFLLLALWVFYLVSGYLSLGLLLIYAPLVWVMRAMTKKDDQRLWQVWLRARMRTRHANRALWGAVSFTPMRYKR